MYERRTAEACSLRSVRPPLERQGKLPVYPALSPSDGRGSHEEAAAYEYEPVRRLVKYEGGGG